MHPLMQAIWGDIWKYIVEKSSTNATNVTLRPLGQAIWGDISKRTVDKSPTNATNVILSHLWQVIWRNIWKRTLEKSQTNATNVTLRLCVQTIWQSIWKCTVENRTHATNAIHMMNTHRKNCECCPVNIFQSALLFTKPTDPRKTLLLTFSCLARQESWVFTKLMLSWKFSAAFIFPYQKEKMASGTWKEHESLYTFVWFL